MRANSLSNVEDLFVIQASNTHQGILLRDFAGWKDLSASINRESLLAEWTPMEFEVEPVDKKPVQMPSICTVYVPGALAFRADVKADLFPGACVGLEFLPIRVGAEPWLLLNCLNTVMQFDEKKSDVMRGMDDDIFMVLKLTVTDPVARQHELFTLSQSNRMQLFALPSFKSRVERLRLKGISFRRIGEVA